VKSIGASKIAIAMATQKSIAMALALSIAALLSSCSADPQGSDAAAPQTAPGAGPGGASTRSAPPPPPNAQAGLADASPDLRRIHAEALTLDTHVDISFDYATDAVDPATADIQVNLGKMETGGLDAAFFIVYVGQTERTPENYAQAKADAMTKFDAIHRMTDSLYPDRISLAYTADDMSRIVADGKLAAAIGIENGYVIGNDLDLLNRYHELGARYVTLVHNGHNDLADSAQPRPQLGDTPSEHNGVSEFGAAAIKRMNELGIMVDISHASRQSAIDAIALSAAPVIASHSSVRGIGDHVRNLDDETLLLLRANGGVVQVVAFEAYVSVRPAAFEDAMRELTERLGLSDTPDVATLDDNTRIEFLRGVGMLNAQWPPANIEKMVDHIDHAVNLIGIDHVGISSDFGGGGGIIGWSDALETPNVTAELLRRGYSEEDIGKIWSGNLLRVWREVERIAETL
jgi:membrane dipeptidase